MAFRLSCSETHGILVPSPEIKPVSPALQGGFLTNRLPGKPQGFSLHGRWNWWDVRLALPYEGDPALEWGNIHFVNFFFFGYCNGDPNNTDGLNKLGI